MIVRNSSNIERVHFYSADMATLRQWLQATLFVYSRKKELGIYNKTLLLQLYDDGADHLCIMQHITNLLRQSQPDPSYQQSARLRCPGRQIPATAQFRFAGRSANPWPLGCILLRLLLLMPVVDER